MAAQFARSNPFADQSGRPPYATNEPDSVFQQQPRTNLRAPQQKQDDPNSRSSAYNMYDNYLDDKRQSGVAALGMLMSGEIDSDDDDDEVPPPRYNAHTPPSNLSEKEKDEKHQLPLAAPKPGYAAPTTQFNLRQPPPALSPEGRDRDSEMRQAPQPLRIPGTGPRAPSVVPSTPHPLPQMTPITPVFARPKQEGGWRNSVRFLNNSTPIIRGGKEETLLPQRGEKGDDFWRRFSMVVHEDAGKKDKESAWLKKTRTGTSSFSRTVWVVGLLLLLAIAGACGLGWYVSHNDDSNTAPKAIGGSAEELSLAGASSTAATAAAAASATSSPRVTPTNTVDDRRRDFALPTQTLDNLTHALPTSPIPARHRRNLHRTPL